MPEVAGLPRPAFAALDYLVLFLYLAGMLYLGSVIGRKVTDVRRYFTAGGTLNKTLVGLSLLGTYLSAITMMALPRISYGDDDWLWTVQLPFLVLTAFVITRFVLPRYRDAGVISVYQFLEQRIHVSARLLAALSFLIFSIARMGIVLYLPALAIATVTHLGLIQAILLMGIVVTIYDILGGIEAVIWTDAVQVLILILGALVSLGYIFASEAGVDFFAITAAEEKFRMWEGGTDLTAVVSLWLIVETIFQTIRIYGTQQDMTQRYMTTRSTQDANQSVWIAILGYIPVGYLFYFIGTALFVYYTAHPDPAVPLLFENGLGDALYPYFVVSKLPPGISGLVIAAFFAGAMSSIDSLMNSSTTVCVEDFVKRFSRVERTEQQYLRLARWLTGAWGLLAVIMAISLIGQEKALVVWSKIMGIAPNGMLGLMALAFLPFKIDWRAAIAGYVAGWIALFYVWDPFNWFFPADAKLTFLLWVVIGNGVCFLLALALHPLLGGSFERHEFARPEGS